MRRRGKIGRITGLACATPAPVSFFRSRQAFDAGEKKMNEEERILLELTCSLIDQYFEKHPEDISKYPDKELLKKGKMIPIGDGGYLRLHEIVKQREIEGVTIDQASWYGHCSEDEIRRIFYPEKTEDVLLKLQADEIADNVRLVRVFLKRREKHVGEWSLSNHFKTDMFEKYVKILPKKIRRECSTVASGIAFLKEPNGQCVNTQYGPLIVISETLKIFLYYMNLFYHGEFWGVSKNDCFHAFLIAIRTMLLSESLDFDLDPRGDLPPQMHREIMKLVDWQMKFVIAHEYAHYYLGHLESAEKKACGEPFICKGGIEHITSYNISQKDELEADAFAILNSKYPRLQKSEFAACAMNMFVYYSIYEAVRQYLYPSDPMTKTHPPGMNRALELRKRLPNELGMEHKVLVNHLQYADSFCDYLAKEFLPFHVEELEKYGSFYLPSFKGKNLMDRIDY